MRYITQDDFIETFSKLKQRGLGFLLSKFSLNESKRTISAFNEWDIEGSNWWMIPAVQQRWNFLITGSAQLTYEQYLAQKYLSTKQTALFFQLEAAPAVMKLNWPAYVKTGNFIVLISPVIY